MINPFLFRIKSKCLHIATVLFHNLVLVYLSSLPTSQITHQQHRMSTPGSSLFPGLGLYVFHPLLCLTPQSQTIQWHPVPQVRLHFLSPRYYNNWAYNHHCFAMLHFNNPCMYLSSPHYTVIWRAETFLILSCLNPGNLADVLARSRHNKYFLNKKIKYIESKLSWTIQM